MKDSLSKRLLWVWIGLIAFLLVLSSFRVWQKRTDHARMRPFYKSASSVLAVLRGLKGLPPDKAAAALQQSCPNLRLESPLLQPNPLAGSGASMISSFRDSAFGYRVRLEYDQGRMVDSCLIYDARTNFGPGTWLYLPTGYFIEQLGGWCLGICVVLLVVSPPIIRARLLRVLRVGAHVLCMAWLCAVTSGFLTIGLWGLGKWYLVLSLLGGTLIAVGAMVGVRRLHPHPAGCCEKCGYNLMGNVSGICPECGTATEAGSSSSAE